MDARYGHSNDLGACVAGSAERSWYCGEMLTDFVSQSVRRKGGKYVYIICSKNPKHKQR